MATSYISRFRRGAGTVTEGKRNDRVGDMLSDSSDDGSPLGDDQRRNPTSPRSSNDSSLDYFVGNGAIVHRTAAAKDKSSTSEIADLEDKELALERQQKDKTSDKQPTKQQEKKTFESLTRSQSSRAASSIKRSAGKKWYSDSDDEDEEELTKTKTKISAKEVKKKDAISSDINEEESSDLDSYIVGSIVKPRGESRKEPTSTDTKLSRLQSKGPATDRKERVSSASNSERGATSSEPSTVHDIETKETNVSRLKTKTRTLSPFGWKGREFDRDVPESAVTNSLIRAQSKRETSPPSEHLTQETLPLGNAGTNRPAKVQIGGAATVPPIIINRRTNRLKHSASGSDYGGSPKVALSSNDEVFSPGLRKVPGVFPGQPGSGVLLEGWLRQKQRRGIKGLKKWNLRYFVLYARSNEVRYYADVVQSAWGPIPLGEIGSISLRLIQRISKLSHPKYKGCRFDITCRNSWGTHYADDYVSSDDGEEAGSSTNVDKTGTPTPYQKQEKGGTPRTSRVYSLVADSPQVTVAWVKMLDSLLTRSANSPRPDVGSPSEVPHATSTTNVSSRLKKSRAVARQRASAIDTESAVLNGPSDNVPNAIIYAINFIFDSTPGIETETFYEVEPESTKLKAALKFLNGFASENVTRKPTKEELDELLDASTAGAVVRLWLQQLEQPLIPFTMYDDFAALAREAQTAPFDLRRNLRALLEALPKKNLTMLACLLFHLNDVNVYSSKNGMDAARLAHLFAQYILRPQKMLLEGDNSDEEMAVRHLVEDLITNVDTFIDEKEAQVLEENRL